MDNIGYYIVQINNLARELQAVSSPAYKPNYSEMQRIALTITRHAYDLSKEVEQEAKRG